jgi:hypothetical protein
MRGFLCGNPLEASHYRPPPRPNPDHAPQGTPDNIAQLAQPPAAEEAPERFTEKLRTGQLASSHMSLAEFDALRDGEVVNDCRRALPETGQPDLQRDLGLDNAVTSMAQAARLHLARKIRR